MIILGVYCILALYKLSEIDIDILFKLSLI